MSAHAHQILLHTYIHSHTNIKHTRKINTLKKSSYSFDWMSQLNSLEMIVSKMNETNRKEKGLNESCKNEMNVVHALLMQN